MQYNLDIDVKTMMNIFYDKEHDLLKKYDLDTLKKILRNFKLIKELLLEYLPIDKQIQDFFNGLQILHDEHIMLSSDIQEIFDKINNNKNNLEKTFVLPLFGKFQANNFLIAYEIAKIYGINDKVIQKGLDEISLAGRFEIFSKNPATILDVAHNDDSVKVLTENLNELFKDDEVIFVLSVLGTKDIANIFKRILEKNYKIFITSLKEVTYGLSAEEIKKTLENSNISTKNIIFEDDILQAYNQAKEMVLKKDNSYKAIVVCGSFYEIAKFKKLFL